MKRTPEHVRCVDCKHCPRPKDSLIMCSRFDGKPKFRWTGSFRLCPNYEKREDQNDS